MTSELMFSKSDSASWMLEDVIGSDNNRQMDLLILCQGVDIDASNIAMVVGDEEDEAQYVYENDDDENYDEEDEM